MKCVHQPDHSQDSDWILSYSPPLTNPMVTVLLWYHIVFSVASNMWLQHRQMFAQSKRKCVQYSKYIHHWKEIKYSGGSYDSEFQRWNSFQFLTSIRCGELIECPSLHLGSQLWLSHFIFLPHFLSLDTQCETLTCCQWIRRHFNIKKGAKRRITHSVNRQKPAGTHKHTTQSPAAVTVSLMRQSVSNSLLLSGSASYKSLHTSLTPSLSTASPFRLRPLSQQLFSEKEREGERDRQTDRQTNDWESQPTVWRELTYPVARR